MDISVIVPVLNEDENLAVLHQRLTEALAGAILYILQAMRGVRQDAQLSG